jgi:hypothetical protein
MSYKIMRYYASPMVSNRTIERGLTLEEAQKHCNDPETSSRTCTKSVCKARTRKHGAWFDGYTQE